MELSDYCVMYYSSSLCMSCSHQERSLLLAAATAAAGAEAMWEELWTRKGCPRPAEAQFYSRLSSRSPPSSHMRTRRWLSPAGSPSTSWRSSFSCCPLQVCHIQTVGVITQPVANNHYNRATSNQRKSHPCAGPLQSQKIKARGKIK